MRHPDSALGAARAPDFEPAHFRQALARFATGVTVITLRVPPESRVEGRPFLGVTASSFNSLSLSPPLVLWSLRRQSAAQPFFCTGSHYVINVLGADQMALCERFAKGQGDRFAQTAYHLSDNGLPILDGVQAWFECHNRSRYDEGDHVLFVGEVERCGFAQDAGPPLVFHGGRLATTRGLDHGQA